jgi:predicted neuraminidase
MMSDQPQDFDVLVAGGGMAGVFAAIAAAKEGQRVCLVEPANILGGQGTTGGVAGFCGDTNTVNHVFDEMVRQLKSLDAIAEFHPCHDRRSYDLELCGFVLQEMVCRSGVTVLLHSRVLDVQVEDGGIQQVDVSTASHVIRIHPKVVIDATGICILAKQAGFPLIHLGANEQLPMSLYFTLWDTGKPVTPKLPDCCPTWECDEDLPMTTLHPFPSGKVEVKMKVIGFDAADGLSLSEAEMHARRQMMGLIYYLQTKGYQGRKLNQHVLASVSRMIGIREACRIEGEHILTQEQVMHEAVFDDAVAVGTYHLDYHWPDRVERAGTGITTMVMPYHIPLRSLIPRGSRNMLVPGRGASGDQMAMSSFRVMATCIQMGYAAGKAASLAVNEQCNVPDVPIKSLQALLEHDGQSLNLSDYGLFLRQLLTQQESVTPVDLPFANCHASTLTQLKNGRFLCAYFAGSKEGHDDVRIWLSIRKQGSWQQPQCIASVDQAAHWNPVLYRDEQGTVHLYFKVGKQIRDWQTWHMTSSDQGETWTTPRLLVMDGSDSRGPVKNKLIVLSNGDWLAPSSVEPASDQWQVFCDRSTDQGKTWQATPLIPFSDQIDPEKRGAIQPTLWESDPGQVHMLTRSRCGWVLRSDSVDFGKTWCPLYITNMPNNNSGLDVAKLNDGSLVLVCNPIQAPDCKLEQRHKLTAYRSIDNGKTWPQSLDLENSDGEFSYPAIIPTQIGMAITYTAKRTAIKFWHGSIEQLSSYTDEAHIEQCHEPVAAK